MMNLYVLLRGHTSIRSNTVLRGHTSITVYSY
nr:MAG TPA: hypothetical protein [Caudoviricetes sp.]